jgi:hypothetical protein
MIDEFSSSGNEVWPSYMIPIAEFSIQIKGIFHVKNVFRHIRCIFMAT